VLGEPRIAQVLELLVVGFDDGIETACRGTLEPSSFVIGRELKRSLSSSRYQSPSNANASAFA
jgi:hypothetical protein